jgi:hypothetical protein
VVFRDRKTRYILCSRYSEPHGCSGFSVQNIHFTGHMTDNVMMGSHLQVSPKLARKENPDLTFCNKQALR